MRLATILALLVVVGCTPRLTNLDLGDPLPHDAAPTGQLLIVSPAQTWPESRWWNGGIEYSLAADGQGRVQYISTSSLEAQTPDGARIGQMLSELLRIRDSQLSLWPGWGYVVELPSGWKAALMLGGHFMDREPIATDRIDLLFKGTLAGYGS